MSLPPNPLPGKVGPAINSISNAPSNSPHVVSTESELSAPGRCCSSPADYLAQTRPFVGAPPDLLHWLGGRVTPETYAPGDVIVDAETPACACYVLVHGRVELVTAGSGGVLRQISVLEGGETFGAEALVTGTPYWTTARALDQVEAFRLESEDFEELLARYPTCSAYFFLLARQRSRPRRRASVSAYPGPDGDGAFILKDHQTYRYLRMSEAGHFLWELMDGERTVRDLSLAYFQRYQRLGVDEVLRVMGELADAEFIDVPVVQTRLLDLIEPSRRRQQVAIRLTSLVQHRFSLPDPDRALDWMYRKGVWLLYTEPAQLLSIVILIVGLGALIRAFEVSGMGVHAGTTTLIAIAGVELQIVLHELAHAMTTKHFGREVHSAGIGWYLFLPVSFVDTSDMWLEGRTQRMAAAAAGPYMNFVLSGAAGCLLLFAGHGTFAVTLAGFAVSGYFLGLINLNPLYELDGYYVLSDLLAVPNLRANALAYIGTRVWRTPSRPISQRLRRIFIGYGLAAAVYALIAAAIVLFGYQALVRQIVVRVLPNGIASALGWGLAATMAVLLLFNLWQGLRRWAALRTAGS